MTEKRIYLGATFSYWTAIERSSHHRRKWLFRCICGTEKELYDSSVVNGESRSCGCKRSELSRKYGADFTGLHFGNWEVIRPVESDRNGAKKYLCRCKCGTERVVYKGHLKYGKTKSCGCLRTSRSGDNHPQWGGIGELSGNKWDSIKRGSGGKSGRRKIDFSITMEYAWDLFLKQDSKCALTGITLDMKSDASLDRIDSNGGYEEGNVQWVHSDINMMKRTYTQEYFIEMCRLVARRAS